MSESRRPKYLNDPAQQSAVRNWYGSFGEEATDEQQQSGMELTDWRPARDAAQPSITTTLGATGPRWKSTSMMQPANDPTRTRGATLFGAPISDSRASYIATGRISGSAPTVGFKSGANGLDAFHAMQPKDSNGNEIVSRSWDNQKPFQRTPVMDELIAKRDAAALNSQPWQGKALSKDGTSFTSKYGTGSVSFARDRQQKLAASTLPATSAASNLSEASLMAGQQYADDLRKRLGLK